MPEGRHWIAITFVRCGVGIIANVEAGSECSPQQPLPCMQIADRADRLAHRPARMNAERLPLNRVHSSPLREDGQGETPASDLSPDTWVSGISGIRGVRLCRQVVRACAINMEADSVSED